MKIISTIIVISFAWILSGCQSDASRASYNISQAADMFEITRRIIFYDAIQGKYLLSIEGLCSIRKDNQDAQLEVTCKVGPGTFKKHFLGISDNVTYFAEQIDPVPADVFRYRVIFKPESIIPDVDMRIK